MLRALARQGFVEGRNLVLEVRTGAAAELPALAEELLATKPDAVLANGSVAIAAVREHSNTVPIVGAAIGGDPVAAGFAVSLARPGGNVTGSLMLAPELDAKGLELLHQAVPTARRIAALGTSPMAARENFAQVGEAAHALGVELSAFYAEVPADYPAAFAAMRSAARRHWPSSQRRTSLQMRPRLLRWPSRPNCRPLANGERWPNRAVCSATVRTLLSCTAHRRLRRPHLSRGCPRRSADRATDTLRVRRQLEDGEGS